MRNQTSYNSLSAERLLPPLAASNEQLRSALWLLRADDRLKPCYSVTGRANVARYYK